MKTETYFNNRAKKLGYFIAPLNENGEIKHYCLFDDKAQWFGRFIPSDGNEPTYYAIDLDKTFNTMPELIEAISGFNQTRLCPARCYGDYGIKSSGIEMAFDWYMGMLGYKKSDEFWKSDNIKVMKNIWGNVISEIFLSIKSDETKGDVCILKGNSVISISFEGVEGVIKAINSVVYPEMLTNATFSLKSIEVKIGDTDMSNVVCIDEHFTVKSMKETIKKALKEALESLED